MLYNPQLDRADIRGISALLIFTASNNFLIIWQNDLTYEGESI